MRINTNVASIQAQEANLNTNKSLSASLEKLSTGLRINKAADDASGLAIADKLRTQSTSLTQGVANANSASALIQIADKAMSEQSTILDTVKAKLIQAATATTTDAGREAIRKDITKLLSQVDEIAKQTNYNGITLLQKSATNDAKQDDLTFQLGEEKSFDVTLSQSAASNTTHLGGGATTVASAAVSGAAGADVNNIGGTGSATSTQKITTSGNVTIATVNVSNDSSELATSGLDVTLSGTVGKITYGVAASMVFDVSNETQAIKDTLEAIAGATANVDWIAATETLSVAAAAGSVDFADLNFSSLGVTTATGAAGAIQLNADSDANMTFSITNNDGSTSTPLMGQLNVQGSATMTGGSLLSDIKNLAADGLTNALANSYMETVDEALTQVNANRADFGSSQNQIQSSLRSMQTTITNLKAAESVIRDVDYAAESANFNKQNIIAQAGTYAMSQANAVSQNVLRLLQ